MDKIKKSKLLELKTKLIKDIREWKPSKNDAPDCFTMLHKYEEQVKLLNLACVSNNEVVVCDCLKHPSTLNTKTNIAKCWNCGKERKQTDC